MIVIIAGIFGLEMVDWRYHFNHHCIFRSVWQRYIHGGFIATKDTGSGFQPTSNLSLRGRHPLPGL